MDDILRPKKRSPLKTVGKHLAKAELLDAPKPPVLHEEVPEMTEPAFVPPEEVADNEILEAATLPEEINQNEKPIKAVKQKRRFAIHMPHSKKQWALCVLISIIVLGGSAAGYWFVIHKPAKPVTQAVVPVIKKKVIPPAPTTEISSLSGLTVPIGTNKKPVTAVMIENSPDARPQSGLKDASIIFEAIAEGGITRFNALFQDTAPDYVGPIRSVRPYYIDWFWPFDASIAHVGGAPQALSDIKSLGIKDLDQFANSGSYDRISSRFAPHNVYTSISRLNDLESKKGYTSANYTGFTRKKETKLATPIAKTINLDISSFYYNVQYVYSPSTNTYLRSEGGEVHKDDKSGTQLAPKVVVAIVMGRGIAGDGQHTDYQTVGSGHMYVFQDGGIQEGTWSKDSRQSQWVFTGADGKVLALNPGQTWISMVDGNSSVTYTP